MTNNQERPTLKIGELARRLGLNVRTLRYYERIGILTPPPRTDSGYRLYSQADERLLRFVLQAKRIGFSLEEIREMVERSRAGSPCDYVRLTLHQHLEALDARIAELKQFRSDLTAAEVAWRQPGARLSGEVCGLIEGWPGPFTERKDKTMARRVEVFTAGCPLCEPVVEMVNRIACDQCDVTVHNLSDPEGAVRRRRTSTGFRRCSWTECPRHAARPDR